MRFSKKQESFLASPIKSSIVLLQGSVSAGKTFIMNLKWLYYIYYQAPTNCLLVMTGRTLGSLYDNVIRFMEDNNTGNDMKFIKAKDGIVTRIIVKSRNIQIACAGADNASSWKSVQGKTHAGGYFDEVSNQPKTLIVTLIKGARHLGQDWPCFMTTNPDIPSHWLRTQYILNKDLSIEDWHFNLDDNPALSPEYRKKVMTLYTGAMYRRFILGEWVSGVDSVVFHNFSREVNVISEPIEYDPNAEILTTWDFGTHDPTAIIVLQIKQIPNAPNGVIIEALDSYQNRNQDGEHYKTWASLRPWYNHNGRRDTGDPSGSARTHDLTSWIVGLRPEFDITPPPRYSVKDFTMNANVFLPSLRINEKQNPELVEAIENWGFSPISDDGLPSAGAKPIHDSYSHLGTALYYGLAYRFPIQDSFKIFQ